MVVAPCLSSSSTSLPPLGLSACLLLVCWKKLILLLVAAVTLQKKLAIKFFLAHSWHFPIIFFLGGGVWGGGEVGVRGGGLSLLAQSLALWNKWITLFISDFCLHQYVIRSGVIPVMISGGKVIGITPALPELENKCLLHQHSIWLQRHNAASLLPASGRMTTPFGPGSQICVRLATLRVSMKALGEHLWKPYRGFICPSALPQVSSCSFCEQVGYLISIVHQRFGNQLSWLWESTSITLDLEN